MISETHIFRHESGPPFFSVLDFEKKQTFLLCCSKSDLKWFKGEERDGSDVKTQMPFVEKPAFFVQFC